MISIEVYAYIFINILAGWISVECQSGQVVLGQICILLFGVGMGFEVGACAIVGQKIGSNNPVEAKIYYNSFKQVTTAITLISITFAYTFRV